MFNHDDYQHTTPNGKNRLIFEMSFEKKSKFNFVRVKVYGTTFHLTLIIRVVAKLQDILNLRFG